MDISRTKMELAESTNDGCSGWRGETDCPHKGRFQPDSDACKECEQDAIGAMIEAQYIMGEG